MGLTDAIIEHMTVEKQTILALEFMVGDVADPDLVADEHIYVWKNNKMGKWLMENADDSFTSNRIFDEDQLYYEYQVFVTLSGPALTAYHLMTHPGI